MDSVPFTPLTAEFVDKIIANIEFLGNVFGDGNTGWVGGVLPAQSGTIINNGNRSYDVPFATTVAGILTPGMRVRIPRTVPAPTQCTSLNGTTQFFNDTSVNGMTFTDDFTVSAWVKLSSYENQTIIGRTTTLGTNGFALRVLTTGQLAINAGNNATISHQSLPLNKWVHVAISVDLSGSSFTLYIDGINSPKLDSFASASFTQSGNLTVGAYGAGLEPFPGKIAQAAVFSSVLSAATIRSYMSQGLIGTEPTLVSAYSFNGVITDLNTTNANNLTAQAAAVATNADSPFALDANGVPGGTNEFGIVTRVVTTTATIQVPEGCAIPTSGGVGSIGYSTQGSPFGMPSVDSVFGYAELLSSSSTASSSFTDLLGATATVYVPTGKQVRVSAFIGNLSSSVANSGGYISVFDSTASVQLAQAAGATNASGDVTTLLVSKIHKPVAPGLRTYKAQWRRATNAATVTTNASLAAPAYLQVEILDL